MTDEYIWYDLKSQYFLTDKMILQVIEQIFLLA